MQEVYELMLDQNLEPDACAYAVFVDLYSRCVLFHFGALLLKPAIVIDVPLLK